MAHKIRHILLVSSPYDYWIMEADCRLSERIINEYRGLNLSRPPRLSWVAAEEEALALIDQQRFDLVITMPGPVGTNMLALREKIKHKAPKLPVIMLIHRYMYLHVDDNELIQPSGIDQTFIWMGNTEILVALIKSVEDQLNVEHDTGCAGIRVILMVEDSPFYLSSILPIIYKEIVTQTQNLIGEGLNEEHRLLTMRARPKILIAENYEAAIKLYEHYKQYVLGVISDVRFPRNGKLDDNAGLTLLTGIKQDRWDIPLLLTSSDSLNAAKASKVPARFIDKNSPSLHAEIRSFVLEQLGFGDFVFRMPQGGRIGKASTLRAMEKILPEIPDESFLFHWNRNDFSRWLFARTEIMVGSRMRPTTASDFSYNTAKMKQYLIESIQKQRKQRLKGVVINYTPVDFDFDAEFFKIGTGSLGGKARGLAFISTLLHFNSELSQKYAQVNISVPQSLVITTEGFDAFIELNDLGNFSTSDMSDEDVAKVFSQSDLPQWIVDQLRSYLSQIHYPLAIRSSSLLEDDQFMPYAGLYRTYMLPNNDPDLDVRLAHLTAAVKLVYASTYYEDPKTFARRVGHRTEEEKMAIIIQEVVGQQHGCFFYPTLSGVAQSYNYYPFSKMKPEEGIVTVAMGLGKLVMEGEASLRFSPVHPQVLPQFAKVEDVLDNSQKFFYALKLGAPNASICIADDTTVAKRNIFEAMDEPPMKMLAGTYCPEEHRIRDSYLDRGHKVLTFASVLKYNVFPLAKLLKEILAIGQEGMGCPIEVEFSVNLYPDKSHPPELAILQLRPMTAAATKMTANIDAEDISRAFCYSLKALGNAGRDDIRDIVYVRPETFDVAKTADIAAEIGKLNTEILALGRKYLLVGPGRWGSADTWLGIPVRWADISGVAAIIEAFSDKLKAEPSQGSHFFHNIITLGINYITVREAGEDFLNWACLTALPKVKETAYVVHACVEKPIALKVDGLKSSAVVMLNQT